jgi:hypothetical protein
MRTISLPVYKRPDRVKRLLETLRACKPDGYTLHISAEPGFPEVLDAISSIDFMPFRVAINKTKLGLNGNIKSALSMAMDSGSDMNVALEDDIVLAKDALRLAEWFQSAPGSDQYACLGLFAYNSSAKGPLEVRETPDFRSWGWCCTRSSWEKFIVPGLSFVPDVREDVKYSDLWDFRLQYYLVKNGIKTLHPTLSRSNHEGASDGTTDLAAELLPQFASKAMSNGSYGSGFYITRATGRVTMNASGDHFVKVHEKVGV